MLPSTVKGAYVMNLGLVPYGEAWELQRSLAGAVSQGAIPDTILLLEHPPVVTTGTAHRGRGAAHPRRRRGRGRRDRPRRQVDVPRPRPARLLPDLRPEAARQDVKRYCRDLEEALILTLAKLGVEASGSTGSPASG